MPISTLIKYQTKKLSRNERIEVEAYLKQNPHYKQILKGLAELAKRIGNDEKRIEQFLETKKIDLKNLEKF